MMKVDQIEPENHVGSYQEEHTSLLSNARGAFVRKVYSILALQMLITFLFVIPSMVSQAYVNFQADNLWLCYTAIGLSIFALLPLACSSTISQLFPLNFLLLFLFTISEAYMVSVICTVYTPESVLQAAAATCAATLGLTFYAVNTKDDFTQCSHFMKGMFWSFLFMSLTITIINIFFIRSDFLTALLALAIAAVYSFYLVIDTQLVMDRQGTGLTLDNYVMGAVLLYLDILQLFIQILKIIGKKK